jgi:NitT/TauT family transport system ATP-binding protein
VSAPGRISVEKVGVRYAAGPDAGEVIALAGIELVIEPGEFVCLLGPSGCGKSTLLNAIAGFTAPTSGSIRVGEAVVKGPGPERGMVFQEYALFPWMTVAQNVAFGLEIQGQKKPAIEARVAELLAQLHLEEFSDRFPKDLSGGMRQRVAIARVLAIDSPILLMDEPFGALDALTRRSLQDQLLTLWKGSGKTIVFVTHSIEESLYLADRIVVMTWRPGTVKRQIRVAIERPRDPGSAAFIALLNEVTALVMEEQARHERGEWQTAVGR